MITITVPELVRVFPNDIKSINYKLGGIYVFRGDYKEKDQILYVGKATVLRSRIYDHFQELCI